jgi:hypothetical protein
MPTGNRELALTLAEESCAKLGERVNSIQGMERGSVEGLHLLDQRYILFLITFPEYIYNNPLLPVSVAFHASYISQDLWTPQHLPSLKASLAALSRMNFRSFRDPKITYLQRLNGN